LPASKLVDPLIFATSQDRALRWINLAPT
jgi:hypothetical protein